MRLALLFSLIMATTASAQVVFKAPKETPPGAICKVDLEVTGSNLALAGFKNGFPTNDFLILKTLDDKPLLFLVPAASDTGAVYTFVASVLAENTVKQTSTSILVKGATPPAPPVPSDPFTDAVRAAYKAAPSPDGAKELAVIYETVAKIDAPAVASVQLRQFCAEKLQPTTLKAVRDVVTEWLSKPNANHKVVLTAAATALRSL